MKFSKKLISLLLCAVMVLGFVAAGGEGFSGVLEKISIRAGAETSGIYTYYVYEGEAEITGCDKNATGSITVPSTIGGYPVTSIGGSSFSGCTDLTSVTIPDSVTYIGWYAFSGCTGLTSITIPASVQYVSSDAFRNCTGLESITVDEDNPVYDSRNNCNAIINTERNELIIGCKNTVIPDSVTSIGCGAFEDCTGLTSITIPDSVTSIGDYAFLGCTGLTSITIPDSVTSIGEYAFYGCTGLESITVDEDNPVYDSRNNCNAIINTERNELIIGCKNTVIPDSVTSIGCGAFEDCTGLTSITIPDSVTSIGDYAFFGCTGLTSITIPDSVTSIGDSAFHGCTGLTSITIPDSVTEIGMWAFGNCTGLESITVDEDNPVYDSRNNCNAIINTERNALITVCKNTVIPDSVTEIGSWAFENCTGLTSITIPDSVTSIGDYAFRGCTGLTSITIPASVQYVSFDAFRNCTALESITVDEDNPVYDSRSNCNAIIDTEQNELIIGCKNTVIPDSVTSIGDYAFSGCTGLTSITIPDSVTSIGDSAFHGCTGLTSVSIPGSVENIGSEAFWGCYELTDITLSDGVKNIQENTFNNTGYYNDDANWENGVLYIGNYLIDARSNVPENYTVKAGTRYITGYSFAWCDNLKSITIPDSVTSIGDYAFRGCTGLESISVDSNNPEYSSDEYGVLFNKDKTELIQYPIGNERASYTIPDSVTEIGGWAFEDCESLEYVHIPSSVTEIGDGILSGTNAYICSDAENCYAKTYADKNGIEFRVCFGHEGCSAFSRIKEAFFGIIRFFLQILSKYIPFLGVLQW